ncbi:MAG: M48 family metalloprotease [Gammaproteobacteria bacterium]
MRGILFFALVLLAPLFTGCAVNPVTGQQDVVLMSEEQEIALGRKTHPQVLQQYGVYESQDLQNYVQGVGEKLAARSHRRDLIYRFTVLDSKEVNAFALPGGYIYITRGLMAYLNSEAELAAVLGHEIGHVTARHAVRQYTAAQLANIGAALGAVFVPGMNTAGANQLVQLFGTALLRGYGREHELEADQLGAEYLAHVDYDPASMLDVIRTLKNQEIFETRVAQQEGREPRIYHGLFSTHPDNDTRLKEIIGAANKYRTAATTYTGRETYIGKINDLIYGDGPKEGILRENGFYHPELGFTLRIPLNWNVTNRPDQLLITAGGSAAIMQLAVQDINKRVPPREFMQTRLGLKDLSQDSPLNINGLAAHTGLAPVNTSFGKRIARFTTIYFRDRAYILAGVARDQGAAREYDRYFLETAQSFHAMTEQERALARPLKIAIAQAGNQATFAELARQSPLKNYPEEQLRLLNGMFPKGEPAANMMLKVIE